MSGKLIRGALVVSTVLLGSTAQAEMISKRFEYAIGDLLFEGHAVYDDAIEAKRPGLLMVPNWMGVNDSQIAKAKAIAGQDYVVFVADVYGLDVRPTNTEEAGKAAQSMYADRELLRARVNEALAQFRGKAGELPLLPGKIGAIGFCFGGTTVLDLARSGADVAGVVSFHGDLGTDDADLAKQLKTSVLVLNGAADTYVSSDSIRAFEAEMSAVDADWQLVQFGGAVHCFAESDANSPPGCVHNERAARRAFGMMNAFFDERFGN
jgi:dienelactone hydrolase